MEGERERENKGKKMRNRKLHTLWASHSCVAIQCLDKTNILYHTQHGLSRSAQNYDPLHTSNQIIFICIDVVYNLFALNENLSFVAT